MQSCIVMFIRALDAFCLKRIIALFYILMSQKLHVVRAVKIEGHYAISTAVSQDVRVNRGEESIVLYRIALFGEIGVKKPNPSSFENLAEKDV